MLLNFLFSCDMDTRSSIGVDKFEYGYIQNENFCNLWYEDQGVLSATICEIMYNENYIIAKGITHENTFEYYVIDVKLFKDDDFPPIKSKGILGPFNTFEEVKHYVIFFNLVNMKSCGDC